MATSIDHDREQVRRLLLDAEERMRQDPDADASNALASAAVAVADRWDAEGRLVELLQPLLDSAEHRRVRYGVASLLLNRGEPGLAVPALESVDVPEAEFVLRKWRRQNSTA